MIILNLPNWWSSTNFGFVQAYWRDYFLVIKNWNVLHLQYNEHLVHNIIDWYLNNLNIYCNWSIKASKSSSTTLLEESLSSKVISLITLLSWSPTGRLADPEETLRSNSRVFSYLDSSVFLFFFFVDLQNWLQISFWKVKEN